MVRCRTRWAGVRMVIAGMLLYTLASVGCVLAPSFVVLLVFRVLQGMAAGIGPTVARAVVRDLYDGQNAQRLMGLMMMIFSVAPALAPVLGGWIHVAFGWRAVFGFMVIMGGCLAVFAWVALPETHPASKRSEFHLGQLVRTSWRIARNPNFTLLALATSVCLGAVLIYIGSAPAIILEQWHLSETQFYYLFAPIIGGFMMSSFASSRIAGRVSRHRMLRIGFSLMAGSSALSLLLQLVFAHLPIGVLQVLLCIMAFGAQFTFPILTLEMLDIYPSSRGAAASVSSFIALGGVSIVMGALAPAVNGNLPQLAVISLIGGVLGFVIWRFASRRLAAQHAAGHGR